MTIHELTPLQPLRAKQPRRRMWWYVHGWHDGVAYTRGHFDSEMEARAMGHQMFHLEDEWFVEELPTSDLNRAKAMFRDRDLNRGASLDKAMQPHHTATAPTDLINRRR